jgi:hypothetical protein
MIRSLSAVVAGQLSIIFLSGFAYLVVALYFRSEIYLSGVSHLPAPFWQYALVFLQLIFGMFGGLVTCSIARQRYGIEVLALVSIIVILGFFEYQFLSIREPAWYLLFSPLAKIAGVWLAYRIKAAQDLKVSESEY